MAVGRTERQTGRAQRPQRGPRPPERSMWLNAAANGSSPPCRSRSSLDGEQACGMVPKSAGGLIDRSTAETHNALPDQTGSHGLHAQVEDTANAVFAHDPCQIPAMGRQAQAAQRHPVSGDFFFPQCEEPPCRHQNGLFILFLHRDRAHNMLRRDRQPRFGRGKSPVRLFGRPRHRGAGAVPALRQRPVRDGFRIAQPFERNGCLGQAELLP